MKKIVVFLFLGVIALAGGYYILTHFNTIQEPKNYLASVSPTSSPTKTFGYQGESEKNALEILRSKASIEQDSSGLVTAINNQKANPSIREYWAFYVNGEMAQVGPQEYVTKDTDKIEWRLETF